jgi:hypothetical protein
MHELYDDEKKVIGEREQKMRLTTIEHKLAEFGRLNARMIQYLETGVLAKTQQKATPSRKKAAVKN